MLLVRFLQSVIAICVIGIILVLFQSGAASTGQIIFSHDYRAPGATEAISFDQPEKLRSFLAELQSGRPDFYAFRATKGDFLKVKLSTARLVGQDAFRPSLALFGPELPTPTAGEIKQLPFSLPAAVGLLVSEADNPEKATLIRQDEPWTQATFWERQSLLTEIPVDGTYYLAVYTRDGQSGKYGLAIGDKPETSLRETLTFPVTWLRVRYWFDDLWWPSLLIGLVVGLIALALWLVFRAVRQQTRSFNFVRANLRRTELRQKRNRAGWRNRRINRAVRKAQPYPFAPPPALVRPAAMLDPIALTEMKQLVAAETEAAYQPEPTPVPVPVAAEPILAGSRWETPPKVYKLPPNKLPSNLPAYSGNGNGNYNGGNGKANGPTNGNSQPLPPANPAPVLDGLAAWGQRYRPKSVASPESSTQS